MDAQLTKILAEYQRREAEELRLMETLPPDEMASRREDFLLAIGADTGDLLSCLIKGAHAKSILEIGTSYGYSTLYLADAARATGGRVTSIELAEHKSRYARDSLDRAGLASHVEFRVGDALEVLRELPGPFDFVLIDLWKDLYVPCLERVLPKLSETALVAADNMIYPEKNRTDAAEYRRRVRELGLESILLSIGSGLELSRRAAA